MTIMFANICIIFWKTKVYSTYVRYFFVFTALLFVVEGFRHLIIEPLKIPTPTPEADR